ncbi:viral A-type inclusion protein [Enterococcus sp. JM4C]|uniref:viral A-type inclusion protein n=1 Tax=Candidatus Enterococcus huntleyi TaxID=1857217 RepID=UPI00137AE6CE|nr:viral A-type inclusion protein [Enterococcus sp. JM4C]KAF1296483.1 viral A-type inclusion protein [Enterococcus sp. JM4C]
MTTSENQNDKLVDFKVEETNSEASKLQGHSNSFKEVKQVASMNVSKLLHDLQEFEEAISAENIPAIYRLYNGELTDELKRSSNQNHEIDHMLIQKIHERFKEVFPFMYFERQVDTTVNYYRIGNYYRQRATIGIDASVPEIFILPEIDSEWHTYYEDKEIELALIREQMNQLDAKMIAGKTKIEEINKKIKAVKAKKDEINETKGLLNRKKIDTEVDELDKKLASLNNQKSEWLPFVDGSGQVEKERKKLAAQYKQVELNNSIVEKEHRLIQRYFGGFEELRTKIIAFLDDYLTEEPANSEEGGFVNE